MPTPEQLFETSKKIKSSPNDTKVLEVSVTDESLTAMDINKNDRVVLQRVADRGNYKYTLRSVSRGIEISFDVEASDDIFSDNPQ